MATTQAIIIGVTGGKEWTMRRGRRNLHPSGGAAGFALCNTLLGKREVFFPI